MTDKEATIDPEILQEGIKWLEGQLRQWRMHSPKAVKIGEALIEAALRAAPAADDGITVTVGNDGVWIWLKARSGKTFGFQPVTLSNGSLTRKAVFDWCEDRTKDVEINGPAACPATSPSAGEDRGRSGAGSGAAPIEGVDDAISRARRWLAHGSGPVWPSAEDAQVFLHAARAYQEAAAELAEMKRDRAARNKIDPTTRLHNLCDALAESRRDSPFTQEAWDAQDEAYREKCDELVRVKGERDAAVKAAARWAAYVAEVKHCHTLTEAKRMCRNGIAAMTALAASTPAKGAK